MPFSRLLLIAGSAKKYIKGSSREDKVILKQKEDENVPGFPYSNELALFFQIDEPEVRRSLNLLGEGQRCCDGLVFYTRGESDSNVICLVEMKSDNIAEAADQIGETCNHLKGILQSECSTCSEYVRDIIWKACLYHRHSSLTEIEILKRKLIGTYGFKKGNIDILSTSDNDIGPLLRGEMQLGETKKSKKQKRHS